MLVQPSCDARFHLTWFNIDSLSHANRTTWHDMEVALQGGSFFLKAHVKHLMSIFHILKKVFYSKYKSSHLFQNTVYFYKHKK